MTNWGVLCCFEQPVITLSNSAIDKTVIAVQLTFPIYKPPILFWLFLPAAPVNIVFYLNSQCQFFFAVRVMHFRLWSRAAAIFPLTNQQEVLNCHRSARIDAEIWTQYQVGVIHAAGHRHRWCSYLPIAWLFKSHKHRWQSSTLTSVTESCRIRGIYLDVSAVCHWEPSCH